MLSHVHRGIEVVRFGAQLRALLWREWQAISLEVSLKRSRSIALSDGELA